MSTFEDTLTEWEKSIINWINKSSENIDIFLSIPDINLLSSLISKLYEFSQINNKINRIIISAKLIERIKNDKI